MKTRLRDLLTSLQKSGRSLVYKVQNFGPDRAHRRRVAAMAGYKDGSTKHGYAKAEPKRFRTAANKRKYRAEQKRRRKQAWMARR